VNGRKTMATFYSCGKSKDYMLKQVITQVMFLAKQASFTLPRFQITLGKEVRNAK